MHIVLRRLDEVWWLDAAQSSGARGETRLITQSNPPIPTRVIVISLYTHIYTHTYTKIHVPIHVYIRVCLYIWNIWRDKSRVSYGILPPAVGSTTSIALPLHIPVYTLLRMHLDAHGDPPLWAVSVDRAHAWSSHAVCYRYKAAVVSMHMPHSTLTVSERADSGRLCGSVP